MKFLIALLLGEETRARQRGASDKELIKRLHEPAEERTTHVVARAVSSRNQLHANGCSADVGTMTRIPLSMAHRLDTIASDGGSR